MKIWELNFGVNFINTIPLVVIDKTSISRSGLASVSSLLTYVVCIMANSLSLVPDTSFIFYFFSLSEMTKMLNYPQDMSK